MTKKIIEFDDGENMWTAKQIAERLEGETFGIAGWDERKFVDLKAAKRIDTEIEQLKSENELARKNWNYNKYCGSFTEMLKTMRDFSKFEKQYAENIKWLQSLKKIRNEFYDDLPTKGDDLPAGDVDTFALIKSIKRHLEKLDKLLSEGGKIGNR